MSHRHKMVIKFPVGWHPPPPPRAGHGTAAVPGNRHSARRPDDRNGGGNPRPDKDLQGTAVPPALQQIPDSVRLPVPPGIGPPAAGGGYPWQCGPAPTEYRQLTEPGWNSYTLYKNYDTDLSFPGPYLMKPGENPRLLSILFNISILICQYFLLYFLFYFAERNINYVY